MGRPAWEPLGRRLVVHQIYDHQGNVGMGTVPLLVFDAWEHAFYLQYRNVKANYVEQLWALVDWGDVAERFARAQRLRQVHAGPGAHAAAQPFAGTVAVEGRPVPGYRHRAPRELRRRIGVLFQQPRLSTDPRMTLRQAIAEPLRAARARDTASRVAELAELVGLTPDLLGRRPHEVSDGQLQRTCLALALALRPAYLVCDEMTTMLDAATTAALVCVIRDYQQQVDAGILAISHDTVLLTHWADRTQHLSSPASRQPGTDRTDRRCRAST